MNSFISVALLCAVAFYGVYADGDPCGVDLDACSYAVINNVLTITGNGDMTNYSQGEAPWSELDFESVSVSGVQSIGDYAFYNIDKPITLEGSFKRIGDYAFKSCTGLGDVALSNFDGSVGEGAFYGSSITSFTVDGTVTEISNRAFYSCGSLQTVDIKSSVDLIGGYAFYQCDSLTSLVIGGDVTSVGDYAFYGCTGSLTIKGSVNIDSDQDFNSASFTSITIEGSATVGSSYYLCYQCYYLENLTIGSLTNQVDSYTFYSLSGVKRFELGYYPYEVSSYFADLSGLTTLIIGDPSSSDEYSIGSSAFQSCYNLESVTLKGNVTSIGRYAFQDCQSLTSMVIPKTVKTIDSYAFGYYYSGICYLTSVTFEGGLDSIGSYAFAYCDQLTSIVIPGSVDTIDSSAFYYCDSLTSFVIDGDVTNIYSDAFYYCTGTLTIKGSVENAGSEAFEYADFTEFTVEGSFKPYYTDWSYEATFYGCSSIENFTIGTLSGDLGEYSLYGLSGVKNLVIGSIEDDTDDDTFYSMYELETVVIGSVPSLGYKTFSGKTYLVSAVIGTDEGSISIGSYAFQDCSNLENLVLKGNITSIGDGAFAGCKKVTSFVFPGNIKSIGSYLFTGSDCQYYGECECGLTSLTIEYGVEEIQDYAFYGCKGINSIVLPNSIKTIGNYAFGKTGKITDVVIPGSVETIGSYVFSYCEDDYSYNCKCELTSLTIENGVQSIGEYAFSNCEGLKSIVIPGSVTEIGRYAFAYCDGVTSLTIRSGVESIGAYAFSSLSELTKLIIPSSVTDIDDYAFSYCYELGVVIYQGKRNPGSSSPDVFVGCSDFERVLVPENYKDKKFCGRNVKRISNSLSGSEGVNSFVLRVFVSVTLLVSVVLAQW